MSYRPIDADIKCDKINNTAAINLIAFREELSQGTRHCSADMYKHLCIINHFCTSLPVWLWGHTINAHAAIDIMGVAYRR